MITRPASLNKINASLFSYELHHKIKWLHGIGRFNRNNDGPFADQSGYALFCTGD